MFSRIVLSSSRIWRGTSLPEPVLSYRMMPPPEHSPALAPAIYRLWSRSFYSKLFQPGYSLSPFPPLFYQCKLQPPSRFSHCFRLPSPVRFAALLQFLSSTHPFILSTLSLQHPGTQRSSSPVYSPSSVLAVFTSTRLTHVTEPITLCDFFCLPCTSTIPAGRFAPQELAHSRPDKQAAQPEEAECRFRVRLGYSAIRARCAVGTGREIEAEEVEISAQALVKAPLPEDRPEGALQKRDSGFTHTRARSSRAHRTKGDFEVNQRASRGWRLDLQSLCSWQRAT